jgi:hypothetical protein
MSKPDPDRKFAYGSTPNRLQSADAVPKPDELAALPELRTICQLGQGEKKAEPRILLLAEIMRTTVYRFTH